MPRDSHNSPTTAIHKKEARGVRSMVQEQRTKMMRQDLAHARGCSRYISVPNIHIKQTDFPSHFHVSREPHFFVVLQFHMLSEYQDFDISTVPPVA